MPRSLKKGPYVDDKLMKKIKLCDETGEKKVIKTWARRSTIIPEFVGHTLAVHTGNKFIPIYIGKYGGTQARRICTNAHFSRPWRQAGRASQRYKAIGRYDRCRQWPEFDI